MILSLFLVCFVALVVSTVLLVLLGHRVHVASRLGGVLLGLLVAVAAGEVAANIWELPSRYVVAGQLLLVGLTVVVALARRVWNPIGQLFFATFLAAALSYLWFAASMVGTPGLSLPGRLASALLFLFECIALVLSSSFTFESCDTVCRARPSRPEPKYDPEHLPMVSLQLATYNEPPDMLIETIKSLEAIDYPRFEVVIVDNNTEDEETWRPVEEYCRDRPNVTFVHVNPWPGFKSGALNLALEKHTHPDAEIIGIVDADYQIDPAWLRSAAGYFVDPEVAFVQTPQDYREYENDPYLRACYDAYKYFFVSAMPSRHQRNSIIFAGTMGLLRRSTLVEVGGWDEWCITEDAELSLRILRAGYAGVFVPQSYGRGIMPLTFSALKSQRFRWCFGGMQILRLHWRDLMPGPRTAQNRLTLAQRVDYLFGSLQWLNDLVYFAFTLVLIASSVALIGDGNVGLRPLYGAAIFLPAALILTGVVRAVWALRAQTGIGMGRAALAFANWLSLSWTVALGCIQGLTRSEGVFLRTPKDDEQNRLVAALWAARAEVFWAVVLWSIAVAALVLDKATPFVVTLFFWQGLVYASAPFMSWLNQHMHLSAQLERRRRSEQRRERRTALAPVYIAASGVVAAAAIAVIVAIGGSNPGAPRDPFAIPARSASDKGPLENLVSDAPVVPEPTDETTTTTEPTSDTEPEETTTTTESDTTTTTASTTTSTG